MCDLLVDMVFSCALGLSQVNNVAGGSEIGMALEGIVMTSSGDVPFCDFGETVLTVSFSDLNHKSSIHCMVVCVVVYVVVCVVVRVVVCVWTVWLCVWSCVCVVVCV